MSRLKLGDRYFYDSPGPAQFSPAQLEQIRRASLARVLCDNVDTLHFVAPAALGVPAAEGFPNAWADCRSEAVPAVDVNVF